MRILLLSLCLCFSAVVAREVPESRSHLQLSYAPVVKQTVPAVVNIYALSLVQRPALPFNDPFLQFFFGGDAMPPRVQSSLGSGVIVRPNGLVITNYHVVHGGEKIKVVLYDRREFEAEIVLVDKKSDLVLLRLKECGTDLPFLSIRDTDTLEVGDVVLAIGNPFGFNHTVTNGIISALARTPLGKSDFRSMIQTDAPINPGNSGGALVTTDGKLAGINTVIYSGTGSSVGIGFAIPSNLIKPLLKAADQGAKEIKRPWLGIKGKSLSSVKKSGDVPDRLKNQRGLILTYVHPKSPLAGKLNVGDIITHADDMVVDDMAGLSYRLAIKTVGDKLRLTVIRQDRPETLDITTIAPPPADTKDRQTLMGRHPLAGAEVATISPEIEFEFGDELQGATEGVIIVKIHHRELAAQFGFKKSDIIVAINNTRVRDVEQLRKVLLNRGPWAITIKRGGGLINMMVEF